MDKSHTSVEDTTNIIVVISKVIKHIATDEEQHQLLEWLEESEDNKKFFANFMANYSVHETVSSKTLGAESDKMLSRLNTRIDAEEEAEAEAQKKQNRLRRLAWGFVSGSVAAAILVGLFVTKPQLREDLGLVRMEYVSNITSDVRPLVLEDGTKVWLKPESSIRYNVAGKSKRKVEIQGEAYFDVARNPDKPFTVKTDNIFVRVLGTAFTVRTTETETEVVLERGSVKILSPEGDGMVTMTPNQKVLYKALTEEIKVEPVYAAAKVTEEYNLITMSEVTLEQIVESVERRYGVTILYKDLTEGKHYDINYLKTDKVEDVMAILEYMTGIKFTLSTR
ncbi:MAG: FecR domain-containing protein [Bacteroidales bacterium]